MLASLDAQASKLIDQIDKTQDPQALRQLYDKLRNIAEELNAPFIRTKDKEYGYKDLLIEAHDTEKFNALTKRVKSALNEQSVAQLNDVRKTLESALEVIKAASLDDIVKSKEPFDNLFKQFNAIIPSEVPETMIDIAMDTYGQIEAWRSVIVTAEGYQSLTNADSSGEAAYLSASTEAPRISLALNYQEQALFTNRIKVMTMQREALDKLGTLFRQPKVSLGGKQYNLIEAASIVDKFSRLTEEPSQQILEDLERNGFARKETVPAQGKTITRYVITQKGFYLVSTAREQAHLDRRAQQLTAYLTQHSSGVEPNPIMPSTTGSPIAIAEIYKLKLLIPDDQIDLLQSLYRRNFIPKKLEVEVKEVETIIAPTEQQRKLVADKRALLQDISAILAVQRKESGGESVNPYFDGLIEYQSKLVDLSAERKKEIEAKGGLTKMITDIVALFDPVAALTIDDSTALQEIKEVFNDLKSLVNEGQGILSTRWKALKIAWKERGSDIAWYSALPVAIAAFFTAKVSVDYGAPLLGGVLGFALAGPAGAAVGGVVGGAGKGLVATVTALFAGLGAGIGLLILANKLEPTEEQRKELNEQLVNLGYKPEDIQKDPTFWQSRLAKVREFMSFKVNEMVAQADAFKQQNVDVKTKIADQARNNLYTFLGLKPDARAVELEAAYAKKQAELDKSLFLHRWLMKRKIINAHRFMLDTRRDFLIASIEHNQLIFQITLKIMGEIADADSTDLGRMFSKFRGDYGKLWSFFTGEKQGDQELTKKQFDQLGSAITDMYKNQVADLMALERLISEGPEIINKASPFGDNTLIDAFRDVLNKRVENLNEEFVTNANALLEAWRYNKLST